MSLKDKLKVVLNGIIIPSIIYIFITIVVAVFVTIISNDDKVNLMLVQGIVNIFLLIALVPLYIRFRKKYSIESNKLDFKNIIYIIAISFSLCIICNILISFIPREADNIVSKSITDLNSKYNIYISLVIVSIIVPLIEEIFFRGFVFDTVKIISNNIFAILISSLFFGIVHSDFQQMLYAFVVGLMLAYIRCKFNSIVYPIIMHALMNLISLALISDINLLRDYKSVMFTMFISICILAFSLIRININHNS